MQFILLFYVVTINNYRQIEIVGSLVYDTNILCILSGSSYMKLYNSEILFAYLSFINVQISPCGIHLVPV